MIFLLKLFFINYFFLKSQISCIFNYIVFLFFDIFYNIYLCSMKNFFSYYNFLNWFNVKSPLKGSLVMNFVDIDNELTKMPIYCEIDQKKAPLFYSDFFFAFSEGLNIWNFNKPYYLEFDNKFFFENFNDYKHLKFHANYLADDVENYTAFFNLYSKNPKNKYFFSPYYSLESLSKDVYNEKAIIRFPKRNFRINKLEYVLKNFNVDSEFFYKETHGKVPFGYSKGIVFNNFKVLNVKNTFLTRDYDLIFSYFSYLNEKTTKFLIEKYGFNNIIYFISNLQSEHLLKLSFIEIQYILKLMHEDPYFTGRSFLDIHWELYNGFDSDLKLSNFKFLDTGFFYEKYLYDNLPSFLKFFFLKNFSLQNQPMLLNPFELNFSKNYSFYGVDFLKDKKYYFKEEELMRLPFHILLKNNFGLSMDSFHSFDINQRARSSVFFNLFYNYNETFRNKFFKYFNFSKLSMEGLNLLFDSNSINRNGKFQKFYYLVDNPWWDCLNFETQCKMVKIMSMERERSHLLMINLIDRFFDNRSFYGMEELQFYCDNGDLSLMNSVENLNNFLIQLLKTFFYQKKFEFFTRECIYLYLYNFFFFFFFFFDLCFLDDSFIYDVTSSYDSKLILFNSFEDEMSLKNFFSFKENFFFKYMNPNNGQILNLNEIKSLFDDMFFIRLYIYGLNDNFFNQWSVFLLCPSFCDYFSTEVKKSLILDSFDSFPYENFKFFIENKGMITENNAFSSLLNFFVVMDKFCIGEILINFSLVDFIIFFFS